MSRYKVFIDSVMWGCIANLTNSSRQHAYLLKNNHTIIDDPTKADYIIINSCGTSQINEDSTIRKSFEYKKMKKPGAKVIIYGCLIKIAPERLKKIDVIKIGLYEDHKMDEIFFNKCKFEDVEHNCEPEIKERLIYEKTSIYLPELFSTLLARIIHFIINSKSKNKKSKADRLGFTTISFGCTGRCSYCVIKKAKGKQSSICIERILENVDKLRDRTKKILFAAEDCGSYGVDTKSSLPELLYKVHEKYPDVSIYIDYLDPYWLQRNTQEYIKLYNDLKIKVVIAPIQSGSNRVVKRMKRRYNVNKALEAIKKLKKVSPDSLIYNQTIVGFPGETTIDFLKSIFAAAHYDFNISYPYSDRKGAESYDYPDKKSKYTIFVRHLIFEILTTIFNMYRLTLNRKLFETHRSRFYFIYG